ncbi:MAG: hypothetical protein GX024_04970 [Clostridiales bacterium]|nr:hypothetical protein [Clostridiales bacterium]
MRSKEFLFIDSDNNLIMKKDLTSIPIKEECIIKKSIELFNDPEPCIIHRTYVLKKIFMEMSEYFDKVLMDGENEIPWSCIPKNITNVIDIKEEVQKIMIG